MKNLILIIILFSFSNCTNESMESDRFQFGMISDEQRELQLLFKMIINDSDTFGSINTSIDTFEIESIFCEINGSLEDCDSLNFSPFSDSIFLKKGDKVYLESGNLIFKNEQTILEFRINGETPEDFPYLELGKSVNNEIVSCCKYLEIDKIDTINKIIIFDFPPYDNKIKFEIASID